MSCIRQISRSFSRNFAWTSTAGLNRGRLARLLQTFHLIFYTILVSQLFYTWKLAGCPGFSDSYICQPVSLDFYLVEENLNSGDDLARLMNLRNFTYLTNGYGCTCSNLTLLVLIHSNTVNRDHRNAIRRTWGSVFDDRYKLCFLLGIPQDPSIQFSLEKENERHGDLIQGNFVDTYRNLTYKHVMGLKWFNYFCPQVKYLLKTDDDVFVNLPKLFAHLDRGIGPKLAADSKLILCFPEVNARACRTHRSKWKVKMSEYRFRSYPTYCSGYTILYSSDVVSALYRLAQRSRYFWIDDVFVTGILALAAGLKPQSFDKFNLHRQKIYHVTHEDLDANEYLIGSSNVKEADMRKLWTKVKPKTKSLDYEKLDFIYLLV